ASTISVPSRSPAARALRSLNAAPPSALPFAQSSRSFPFVRVFCGPPPRFANAATPALRPPGMRTKRGNATPSARPPPHAITPRRRDRRQSRAEPLDAANQELGDRSLILRFHRHRQRASSTVAIFARWVLSTVFLRAPQGLRPNPVVRHCDRRARA